MSLYSILRSAPRLVGPLVALAVVVCYFSSPALQFRLPVAHASENATSCITLTHVYLPSTAEDPINEDHPVVSSGVDGLTYAVGYRLHTISSGTWTGWITPIEEVAATLPSGGAFSYQYDTASHDDKIYDEVEWRVITDSHSGTDSETQARLVSDDFFEGVTKTRPGGSSWAPDRTRRDQGRTANTVEDNDPRRTRFGQTPSLI